MILENTAIDSPPLCPELRLHLLRPDAPIRRVQPQALYADGVYPYWGFAWSAGQALARHLLDHPDIVRDKRVHDCGAGSGIAAIAAALAGARSVVASDMDATALIAIEMNAELNGVDLATQRAMFSELRPDECDVLLVGDVFYKNQDATWLELFRRLQCTVLVANALGRRFPDVTADEIARYSARTYPEVEQRSIAEAVILRLRHTSVPVS